MAQEVINVGTANARDGDDLRASFVKVNNNFTELYGLTPDAVVNVTEASQLAGVLDSTKLYFLDGSIDMGSQSIDVPAGGLNFGGYSSSLSKLVSNDAGFTLFTSPVGGSGNLLGNHFAIEVTGSGSQVYDLSAATGDEAVELESVNFNNCTSLGTIDGYRQGLEVNTGRFGGSPELTLASPWSGGYRVTTSIVRGLSASFAGTLFKAGAGFTMGSRFLTDINCDLPASASLLDFAAANFPVPSSLQVRDAIISRNGAFNADDANLTPNITSASLSSSWRNNVGLKNTFEGGTSKVTAEVATVVAASSTYYDLAGTYTASDLQHFDAPANGQLRHLGNSPREYRILGDLSLAGTANDVIQIKIVKWDASATSFVDVYTQRRVVNNFTGSRDVAFFSPIANVTLDQNDYVKIQVENQTGARNVTAELDGFYTVIAR